MIHFNRKDGVLYLQMGYTEATALADILSGESGKTTEAQKRLFTEDLPKLLRQGSGSVIPGDEVTAKPKYFFSTRTGATLVVNPGSVRPKGKEYVEITEDAYTVLMQNVFGIQET